ncbi:hypothetical protein D0466_05695 [Peribacillus glennii]|uniref:YwqI/YxiC family protein n=1 Tax=Peribacillus glennii TaxID=2303991 RepID=A0A372LGF8_9BACI|nr:hypothetical protein D0466_05695 [Peribacillus glennii]
MSEIKLRSSDIKAALKEMNSAAEALETSYPSDIASRNQMDIVNRMNEINASMQQALETYKKLLLSNVDSTMKSTEWLEHVDAEVARAIKYR